MDAIDHVPTALLRLGDRAIVEIPCFPRCSTLLEALVVQPVGVDADAKGMLPPRARCTRWAPCCPGRPSTSAVSPSRTAPTCGWPRWAPATVLDPILERRLL